LEKEGVTLTNFLPENQATPPPKGKHKIVLEGYAYRWYRVAGWATSSNGRSTDALAINMLES
jgi:hypothetical protein